jgi:tripartite-type tricarboxylate transporter receptor subunit TctC
LVKRAGSGERMKPTDRDIKNRALCRQAQLVVAVVALAISATSWANAFETAFPHKPIKFVLGFGVGGPTDVIARTLADQISNELGQRIIVENKIGASGNIATQFVASADADGYTYLIGATPLAVNHSLFPDFPVRFGKDLIAIAPIGANANVLVVRPSLNVHTVADFVQRARSQPNAVSYATVGIGSSSHLAGVAFDLRAGTTMLPIGYRGGGEALKDLLSGRVDAWFAPVPSVLGSVQAGQLLALGTTGPQRVTQLPAVPTMSESGFPDFDIRLWVGVFARAGVPVDAMRVIEQAIARAMASKDTQAALEIQGIAPLPMSRAEFSAFVSKEIERWNPVVAAFKK